MVNNIRDGLISAKEGKQEGVDFLYYNTYQDQYRRIYFMVINLALSDEEKTRFTQDILAESYNFVFANINAVQSEEQFMDWLPKVIDDIAKRKIYEFLGSGAGHTDGVSGAETYEDGEEKGPGAGMATGAAVGAATGIGAAMFNGAYGAANVEAAGSMVGASSIGGKAAAVGRSASAGRAVSVGNKVLACKAASVGNKALAGKAASAVEAGKGIVTASVKASGTIAKETVGAVAKETVGAVARETAGAVAKGAVAGVAKTGVFASVGAKIACAVACVAVLGGTATGVILHLHDKDKEVIAESTTEATSEVAVSEETTTEGTTEITTEATTEVTTEAPPPEPYEIAVSEIPEKDSLYQFLNLFENYGDDIDKNYSCENPPDNIVGDLLTGDGTFEEHGIVDLAFAPGYQFRQETTSDPTEMIGIYSAAGIEWIEKNVLNMSDDAIQDVKDALPKGQPNKLGTYLDGDEYYYYTEETGGWLEYGYCNEILKAEYDGIYYYLTVDAYRPQDKSLAGKAAENFEPNISRTQWKLELKEMDGKKFWSIYECKSLHADWAVAYADKLKELDQAGELQYCPDGGKFSVTYVTNDDIPEIGYASLTRGGFGNYCMIMTYYDKQVSYEAFTGMGGFDFIKNGGKFLSYGIDGAIGWTEKLYYINKGKIYVKGSETELRSMDENSVIHTEYNCVWDDQEIPKDEYEEKFAQVYDENVSTFSDAYDMENVTTIEQMCDWLMIQPPELQ